MYDTIKFGDGSEIIPKKNNINLNDGQREITLILNLKNSVKYW